MKKVFGMVLLSSLLATSAIAQTAPAAAPARPSKPVATNPAQAAAKKAPAATKTAPTAAQGGPDQVWVNGKVYHCPGTHYYGNTKNGQYMSEQAAIAAGARASHNRPCKS